MAVLQRPAPPVRIPHKCGSPPLMPPIPFPPVFFASRSLLPNRSPVQFSVSASVATQLPVAKSVVHDALVGRPMITANPHRPLRVSEWPSANGLGRPRSHSRKALSSHTPSIGTSKKIWEIVHPGSPGAIWHFRAAFDTRSSGQRWVRRTARFSPGRSPCLAHRPEPRLSSVAATPGRSNFPGTPAIPATDRAP